MQSCKDVSHKAIEGVIRAEIQEIIVGRHMKLTGSDKELSPEQLEHMVNKAYCHLIGVLPLIALGDVDDVILRGTFEGQDIEGQRHGLALPRWLFKSDAEYEQSLPASHSDKPFDLCELPYWLFELVERYRPK